MLHVWEGSRLLHLLPRLVLHTAAPRLPSAQTSRPTAAACRQFPGHKKSKWRSQIALHH